MDQLRKSIIKRKQLNFFIMPFKYFFLHNVDIYFWIFCHISCWGTSTVSEWHHRGYDKVLLTRKFIPKYFTIWYFWVPVQTTWLHFLQTWSESFNNLHNMLIFCMIYQSFQRLISFHKIYNKTSFILNSFSARSFSTFLYRVLMLIFHNNVYKLLLICVFLGRLFTWTLDGRGCNHSILNENHPHESIGYAWV